MESARRFSHGPTLPDDAFLQYPDDIEQTVLHAIRTWMRPGCRVQRKDEDWQYRLLTAGLSRQGLDCFDLLMRTLAHATRRPPDTRCRCASDLTHDEAALLQVIGLLQRTCGEAATQLLDDWLPEPSVGGMLKFARWFALALLDAGLTVPVRARRVSYLH